MASKKRVRFDKNTSEIQPVQSSIGRRGGTGTANAKDFLDPDVPDQLRGEEFDPGSASLREEGDGRALTAFNLREELETGYVDDEGNFVPRRRTSSEGRADSSSDDEGATGSRTDSKRVALSKTDSDLGNESGQEDDAWVDSLGANAEYASPEVGPSTKKARVAEEKPELSKQDVPEATSLLHALLTPGEQVSDALRRLGGRNSPGYNAEEFERLTELADFLLNHGQPGIYNTRREGLRVEWDLRWGSEGDVQGPFTSKQMGEWLRAGYFKENIGREAFARRTGSSAGGFGLARETTFE